MKFLQFLCLILLFFSVYSQSAVPTIFPAGSSLSVENPTHVLISKNTEFTAGFFLVGVNAYCFAIWFTGTRTPVWMANRDRPVNGKRSELRLRRSGDLELTDAGQTLVWSTSTKSNDSRTELKLLDNGNLVSTDHSGVVLWQSFDSPTDTLLPGQELAGNTKLVSSRSRTNKSSGFYELFFDNDNILRLLYRSPEISTIYWPDPWLLPHLAERYIFNDSRIAVLDSSGDFTASDTLSVSTIDRGVAGQQRRLTVDPDGNLRIYSRKNSRTTWVVTWEAVLQPCKIHGICGSNSLCMYVPSSKSGRRCSCVPGYKMVIESDWTRGCEPAFKPISCQENTSSSAQSTGFAVLPNVEFYGYDVTMHFNLTLERCKAECVKLCDSCVGFHYKFDGGSGVYFCYPKRQLRNGYTTPGFNGDIYLKLPKTVVSSSILSLASNNYKNDRNDDSHLHCSSSSTLLLKREYKKSQASGLVEFMLWFAVGVGALEVLVVSAVWFFVIRGRGNNNSDDMQGYIQLVMGFKKFSYSELKKATGGFSTEIGRGGGGTVFKAVLADGRVAAVKRLEDTNHGEAEFLAEVNIIGRLNHMNLIEMWGYCAEGNHKLLLYEYMEHGSLAKNLASSSDDNNNNNKVLGWKRRFEIALGTARGLAYLHEECLEWVLHCDVKPHNILLDRDFRPKVADFGLSKLLSRSDHQSFSRIRGTRGYMAPEWVYNLPITSKVDVYSFGVVALEIVTGNNPARGVYEELEAADVAGNVRPRMLVTWVREILGRGLSREGWVEEIVDTALECEYNMREVEVLVKVALECVDEDRDSRPTMTRVVEMLMSCE